MSDYAFSFAGAADAADIAALVERAYRGPEAAKGRFSEAGLLAGPRSSATEIASLIAAPDVRFLVVRDSSALAGCALLQKDGDGAYFGLFAIRPDLQGSGLGKEVLAHAEEAARALWSARVMRLTVINVRTELVAWYERRGFALTGEHRPFPFTETSGALRTDFDLAVLEKSLLGQSR